MVKIDEMAEVEIRQIDQLHCHRCGYDWFPRSIIKPARCPRCKSDLWQTPKIRVWERDGK